jgi:hypothetical protein
MSCAENSKVLNRLQIGRILGMMRSKGYVIYTDPYKLNIIGVRNTNTNPVKFDDTLSVLWKDDRNIWNGKEYAITTDPSTRYLNRPINKLGAAIMPNGQYIDSWKIRKHRGKYDALGQDKIICVYRDYDRSDLLTFDVESQSCEQNYGMNIHKAKSGGADDGQGNTAEIGPYSAGCQVFQNSYCFEEFMEMAKYQRELYGNAFTYTLFDLSLQRKFFIKRALYSTAITASVGLIGYGIYLTQQED